MLCHMAEEAVSLLDVVGGCHKLLSTLDGTTRTKAIKMLLLAFDEEGPAPHTTAVHASQPVVSEVDGHSGNRINRRAQYWLKKYELREDELEKVF
ncbi:MAG: hypothetical protein JWO36_5766, partial [Myxococcales bacterium]|nr:hypothetical protein [Myxococcales bacterium]